MHHQLILGGQKSGKSREAERRATRWAAGAPGREAVLVATALALDDEMRARIARHRAERPAALDTVEAPRALAAAIRARSAPHRLLVVDCLTLWLVNWLMPADGVPAEDWPAERTALLAALEAAPGPVVMVSNEIGWGVIPLGREVRRFVDELGRLHQDVAARCADLTLMVAGQAWRHPVRSAGQEGSGEGAA